MAGTTGPAGGARRRQGQVRAADTTAPERAARSGARDKQIQFSPARPRRVFDEIIAQMKAMISGGELRPGDRLPAERALAEQFAVSRNTVREALRMLEIAGLVELKRGATGGAFIAAANSSLVAHTLSNAVQLTDFSLADVTATLLGLSSMAAVEACKRMTDEDVAALDDTLRTATELAKAGEWERKAENHLRFHTLLAEATGNPVLVLFLRTLLDVVGEVILTVGPTQDDSIIRARRSLLRALRARDADAAAAELTRYFSKLHKMWLAGQYAGGNPAR